MLSILALILLLETRSALAKKSILLMLMLGRLLRIVLQQLEFQAAKLIDTPLLPGGEMMLIMSLLVSTASNPTVSLVSLTHLLIH